MAMAIRDTLFLSLSLWTGFVLTQKNNFNAVAAFQIHSSIRSVTIQLPPPYHTFSLHAKKDAKVPFFATETATNSTTATTAAGVAGVGGTLTAARTVTTAGTIAATAGTAATTTTTTATAATATVTAAGSTTTASVGSVGGSIAAARTVTTAGTIAATAASSTASTVTATSTATATTAATTAASTAASTAGRVAIGGVAARGAAAGTTAAVVSSSSGTATTATATATATSTVAATASAASRAAVTGATVTAVSSNTASTATGTATAAGVASRGASATAIAGSKIVAARGATTAATGIAIADMAADGSLAVGVSDAITGNLAGSEVLLADATAGAGVEAWSGVASETLELLTGAEDILLGDSALDAAAAIGVDGLEAIELEAVGSGLSGMGDAILVAMGDAGLGLLGMLPGWLLSGGLVALMGELVFAMIAFFVVAKTGVQIGAGVVNKGGEVLKDAVFNGDNNDSDRSVEVQSRSAGDGMMALELQSDHAKDGAAMMMEEAVIYSKLNEGMEMSPSASNSNSIQEAETKSNI